MKAAILCPGPSVKMFGGREGYSLTVGVNRAPLWYAVDVWAATDYPTVERFGGDVIGTPALLTSPEATSWFRDHAGPWRGVTIELQTLHEFLNPSLIDWPLFSFTAAIVYSAAKGAIEIECFGVDWSGTADADGREAGGNRSIDRWLLESRLFAALQTWLAARKVQLMRVIPTAV